MKEEIASKNNNSEKNVFKKELELTLYSLKQDLIGNKGRIM